MAVLVRSLIIVNGYICPGYWDSVVLRPMWPAHQHSRQPEAFSLHLGCAALKRGPSPKSNQRRLIKVQIFGLVLLLKLRTYHLEFSINHDLRHVLDFGFGFM